MNGFSPLGKVKEAQKGLRDFTTGHKALSLSEDIQLGLARWNLTFSTQKEKSVDRASRLLQSIPQDRYPLSRLALLSELLRHTSSKSVEKEARELAERIRKAIPKKYQESFEKRQERFV